MRVGKVIVIVVLVGVVLLFFQSIMVKIVKVVVL